MTALAHDKLMDRVYRVQRHVYDATRKFYLLGRDGLIDGLKPMPGGTVLELGCGTGRNLICAARKYPKARYFGLDISAEMLSTAGTSVRRSGLAESITLARGDAAAFDPQTMFGHACFDRVFLSYAVSMIPPWQETVRGGLDILKPGGSLHIVDFGQQEKLPPAFKSFLVWWLKSFHVAPRPDLKRFLFAEAQKRGYRFEARSHARDFAWLIKVERPRTTL